MNKNTKIYKCIEEIFGKEEVYKEKYDDPTLTKVLYCYNRYAQLNFNGASLNHTGIRLNKRIRQTLLEWIEQVSSIELSEFFNEHEVMDLLSPHENKVEVN